MTQSQDRALAEEVHAAVRAVPGVSGLFPAGSGLLNAVDSAARALGIRVDDSPFVRIERTSEALVVHLAIGVVGSGRAGETAERVHAAVDALLTGRHDGPTLTRITVMHVEDEPSPR